MHVIKNFLNNKEQKVKNYIFQGGSVKGLAYLGALDALEKKDIKLKNIEKIGGTSVGAITAALLSVGCNCKNLSDITLEMDFENFLDVENSISENICYKMALNRFDRKKNFKEVDEVYATIQKYRKRVKDSQWVGLIVDAWGSDNNLIKTTISQVMQMYSYLQENKGLAEGVKIREWIEDKIQSQTGIKNLTFKELKDLHAKDKEKYKLLYLIGTNICTQKSEVFSHELTPDLIISDAVRISMSLPVIFQPHQQYVKKGNKRCLAKKDLYIDGGVMDNYPIWLFDDTKNNNKKETVNSETLGFRLLPLKELMQYDKEKENIFANLFKRRYETEIQKIEDNFPFYIVSMLSCFYNKQESDFKLQEDNHVKRTIMINDHNVSTFKFNLSDEEKQNLIRAGETSASMYIDKYKATKPNNFSITVILGFGIIGVGGIIGYFFKPI